LRSAATASCGAAATPPPFPEGEGRRRSAAPSHRGSSQALFTRPAQPVGRGRRRPSAAGPRDGGECPAGPATAPPHVPHRLTTPLGGGSKRGRSPRPLPPAVRASLGGIDGGVRLQPARGRDRPSPHKGRVPRCAPSHLRGLFTYCPVPPRPTAPLPAMMDQSFVSAAAAGTGGVR